MVVYRFKRSIELGKKLDKIEHEALADIFEEAEEEAHKKLIDEVSRHYIGFIIDSELTVMSEDDRTILNIYLLIDLDISPLIEKVTEQDRIAGEIADVFFRTIERKIREVLERTD